MISGQADTYVITRGTVILFTGSVLKVRSHYEPVPLGKGLSKGTGVGDYFFSHAKGLKALSTGVLAT